MGNKPLMGVLVYVPPVRRTTSSTLICFWGVVPSGTTTLALPLAAGISHGWESSFRAFMLKP